MAEQLAEQLAERCWPELDAVRPVVLVPVGSLEQHGPHLPLDTDTRIADQVARAVARQLTDHEVVVAPAVGYGASGEHEHFPGTVSIGHEALHQMVVEVGRSACRWSGPLIFVNGHGGNTESLRAGVRRLRAEGRPVSWVSCSIRGGDLHAGRAETSLLCHLAPHVVQRHAAVAGPTAPLDELWPALRAHGVRAISPSGVLGDPTGSSAAEGARLFAELVADVTTAVLAELRRVAQASSQP